MSNIQGAGAFPGGPKANLGAGGFFLLQALLQHLFAHGHLRVQTVDEVFFLRQIGVR